MNCPQGYADWCAAFSFWEVIVGHTLIGIIFISWTALIVALSITFARSLFERDHDED